MFVKPVPLSSLPAAAGTWQDHAGNPHFVLQSRRRDAAANVMRSLFSGLSLSAGSSSSSGSAPAAAGTGSSTTSDAAFLRSLAEYDFRILLRFVSRKADYIIAVDDSFEKIHTDWNWVEQNLFLKLMEADTSGPGSRSSATAEQTDALLLRQFEEMTEHHRDPQSAGASSKLSETRNQLIQIFPTALEDVLLNAYPSSYCPTENTSVRGQICICRNTLYFYADAPNTGVDANGTGVFFAFREVGSLELVPAKRVLMPDQIQLGVKDKIFSFAFYFNCKEVFRILTALCNAAMNRLIKGAESSLSASSEMFSKNSSNLTGDLGITSANKSGGLLMGRSREAYGMDNDHGVSSGLSAVDMGAVPEGDLGEVVEQDFTEQISSSSPDSVLGTPSLPSASSKHVSTMLGTPGLPTSSSGILAPGSTATAAMLSSHTVVRYSHIKTALVNSVFDLDTQLKNLEFRNLFRLSYHETITMEESPCYYFHKPTSTSYTGNMYLSQNFAVFAAHPPTSAASGTGANAPSIGAVAAGSSSTSSSSGAQGALTATVPMSMLFESSNDPSLVFVIPYPHIVSIKKQPATALPLAGKLSSFSLSGYLVVSTKNRGEFWTAFSATKNRDRVSDVLLSRIRTVDWRFDDDVVIGGRNVAPGSAHGSTHQLQQQSSQTGMGASSGEDVLGGSDAGGTESMRRMSSASSLISHSLVSSSSITGNVRSPNSLEQAAPSRLNTLKTGLNFIIQQSDRPGKPSYIRKEDPTSITKWTEYFDTHGRDVCIIKDHKLLRELLLRTDGVPECFRGDFWMLISGAWYSKPEPGYYENLLQANQGRVSPVAEEIEKDVHRSLPEHPAYQSPLGIDALRRVLTAFSWRNPAIGYAQALNIISAVLLLHLREEDAFWMLCVIVERMLPDHYTKTLVGSVVDQAVFKQLVRRHLPALDAHLDKLYMDLSTFSVPWFLCLYLNSVALHVGVKLLDYFFLEGPKFLFWIAVGVLKVNENKLMTKGKDDDIFVAILKDFFTRLGLPDSGMDSPVAGAMTGGLVSNAANSGSVGSNNGSDTSTIIGRPLYELLISTACNALGPYITSETIESLRMRHRLRVVHQMEDTNRKSQVRTLCEQVALSFDEVSAVYDHVRRLEFIRGEEEEDPNGPAARVAADARVEEDDMRAVLASLGGWGLVRRYTRSSRSRTRITTGSSSINNGAVSATHDPSQKSIMLHDFRRVFAAVSPWRGSNAAATTSSMLPVPTPTNMATNRISWGSMSAASNLRPHMLSTPSSIRRSVAFGRDSRSSVDSRSSFLSVPVGVPGSTTMTNLSAAGLGGPSINVSGAGGHDAHVPTIHVDDLQLPFVDRVYYYCSFQYNFVQRQKRGQHDAASSIIGSGGNGAGSNVMIDSAMNGVGASGSFDTGHLFSVDLAALVHVLDATMKQPLHSRLRFMFDLHDLDGDGFLSKSELKAVMDSFLEMFEASKGVPCQRQASSPVLPTKNNGGLTGGAHKHDDEEAYFRAVSSFLTAALQMGNNKTAATPGIAASVTQAHDGAGDEAQDDDGVALQRVRSVSISSHQLVRNSGASSSAFMKTSMSTSSMPADTTAKPSSGFLGVNTALGIDEEDSGNPNTSTTSLSAKTPTTAPLSRTATQSSSARPTTSSRRAVASANSDISFRLSFNEFLLSVLSQTIFVQYFERTWSIVRELSGAVSISYQTKAAS